MSEEVDKRFPGAHMEWALDLEDGRCNQGPGVLRSGGRLSEAPDGLNN